MITALQLYEGKLSLIQKPAPEIVGIHDVKLRVTHGGVCGTDLHIIDGHFPAAKKLILGHEFAGIVLDVGSDVQHVKAGDRVCVNPYDWCSSCHYCSRGQPQFCSNDAMRTAHGYWRDGGMQEQVIVSARLVHPLPEGMTLKEAVFCQPLSTIVRGWDNMGRIETDAKILIGGAGIIGLLWAAMFHHHGYRDVTISELKQHRWEMASRLDLGYSVVLPSDIEKNYEQAKAADDDSWGYDVVVDCTGAIRAVEGMFKWLRKGATLVLFGVCPQGNHMSVEPFQIYRKEIKIVSSYLNKFTFPRTIKLVHDMSQRYLDWKKLDVQVFTMEDYDRAFAALRNGDCSKAVFELDQTAV